MSKNCHSTYQQHLDMHGKRSIGSGKGKNRGCQWDGKYKIKENVIGCKKWLKKSRHDVTMSRTQMEKLRQKVIK